MSIATEVASGTVSRRTARASVPWIGTALVLALLPSVFSSPVAISLMNQMGIAVIFALSYNMLLGQGGMLSFGHAVYFGLGGFIAIHVLNVVEGGVIRLPIVVLPLAGGLAGLGFGALFGTISTNRAGTVFAMISLGIGELIASSSLIFDDFFGGEEGITGNRTAGPTIAGIDFASDLHVYYLMAFWVLVATLLMYAFSQTPIGRMANAVRDNAERAEFVGYSQRWVRFCSFCAAGCFAGIAGGLFAVNYEILTEENLNLSTSGQVLLMTYIGGVGYFVGPIIGAILFTFLQSMLSDFTDIWLLYLGLLFLGTVMFAPTGFAGILMMHEPARRAGRLQRLAWPYVLGGAAALIAAAGAIGLLETLHFWSSSPAGRHTTHVLGIGVDIASPVPWLVFAALLVAGMLGLKRIAPRVVVAFHDANTPDLGSVRR